MFITIYEEAPIFEVNDDLQLVKSENTLTGLDTLVEDSVTDFGMDSILTSY